MKNRILEWVKGKKYVLAFGLIAVGVYWAGIRDLRELVLTSLFLMLAFVLGWRVHKTFEEFNFIWRFLFILGETVILVLVLKLFPKLRDYDLIIYSVLGFIGFQLLFWFYTLVRRVFNFIVKLIRRGWFGTFAKRYLVFLLLIAGLGALGWRNWELTGRVERLETAIGESRLLCDEKETVERVKKSVVRIIGRGIEGSGFVIKKDRFFLTQPYILTNHHVVARDMNPKVVLPDYTLLQGEVVTADKESDLAIIKVDQGLAEVSNLEFGHLDNLENLDELIAVGYPLGTNVPGEATANKGHFVAVREQENFSTKMVQTDIELGYGMSGGPMIDICGKVYGVNTINVPGLSLAIAGDEFVDKKWKEMMNKDDPTADIEKIEFKPNESPLECVRAFYNYQTIGELKKAYDLLSTEYTSWTFERWKKGYKNTLYIIFVKAEEVEDEENTVFVKFYSADLIDEKLVYKYFEGTQTVKDYNGVYKLEESNIKEIEKPGFEWYFNLEED